MLHNLRNFHSVRYRVIRTLIQEMGLKGGAKGIEDHEIIYMCIEKQRDTHYKYKIPPLYYMPHIKVPIS